MNVIAHLLRHEEAAHKAEGIYRSETGHIRDPDLTSEGRYLCRVFSQIFGLNDQYITHIWCSPMRRTINTALLSFEDVIARGVKVQAMDVLQNWDSSPNGTGMDKSYLHDHFSEQVDFAKVEDGWNVKPSGKWAYANHHWRFSTLKQALKDLRSSTNLVEVAIVTHGSFLNTFTSKDGWRGSRVRSYLINELGEPCQELDSSDLKHYRSHSASRQPTSTLNQDLSNTTEQSGLANLSDPKMSEHSGRTLAVKIKSHNTDIIENNAADSKALMLNNAKPVDVNVHALMKLFQEEGPGNRVEEIGTQGVVARMTSISKKRPRKYRKSYLPLATWRTNERGRMLDCCVAENVVKVEIMWFKEQLSVMEKMRMKEQMWINVMVKRAMEEKARIVDGNEDDDAKGREIVVPA